MQTKIQTELAGFERPEIPSIVAAAERLRRCRDELKRQTTMLELDVDEAEKDLQRAMAAHAESLATDAKGRRTYRYRDGETTWEARYRCRTLEAVEVKRVKEGE